MNILQISEYLKGVPKDFLIKEATLPSGNYPQYLVVSELSRRTSMEKQFAGIASQQTQPQETVAERTIKEATAVENVGRSAPGEMPVAGIASQGTRSGVPTGMQMMGRKEGGMIDYEEPSGQETMGIPAAVRMFEGGKVSFDRGGFGADRLKEEEDYKLPFYKRLGKFIPFSRLFSEKDEYGLAPDDYTDTEVLEARIAELGDPDPSSPSFLMKQNLLSKLSEQREKLESEPRGGIAVDFPYFGQADSLTRNIKAMDKQIANMEDGPEKQALIEQRNAAEEKRVSLYKEGKAPSITEEVAKDQANRADETAPPETKKPKGEPKEKAPKFDFEKYVEEKLPLQPLLEDLKKDVAEKFPDLNKQSVGELLQGVKDLRSEDYTAKMKGLVDEIEDEALKADMQAIPNAIVAFGIGIANGDPSKGILGGAVDGLAQAFGVFQNQKKEAREIRRMKREAMGNLYQMASAQQEGDIREAQRQKDMYTQQNNAIQMAEAQMSFEIGKEAITDNKARLLLMVQRKSDDINAAFDMAKTQIASNTQLQIASAEQKQKYIQDFIQQNFNLDKILLDPTNTALLDDKKLGVLQGQIDQAKQKYAGMLAELLGVGKPEGMKGGGMTKVDQKPKSLFDFHKE